MLGIGFVGLSYIIIYIGAITVLFLFIIMMINIRLVDILEIGNEYTKNLPLAIILGLLFVYEIFSIIPFTFNNIYLLYLPLNILNHINSLITPYSGNVDSLQYIVNLGEEWSGNIISNKGSDILNNSLNYTFNIIDSFIFNLSQIEVLGLNLYTNGSIWLFLCSFILLLSMLAPIMLSSFYKKVV